MSTIIPTVMLNDQIKYVFGPNFSVGKTVVSGGATNYSQHDLICKHRYLNLAK